MAWGCDRTRSHVVVVGGNSQEPKGYRQLPSVPESSSTKPGEAPMVGQHCGQPMQRLHGSIINSRYPEHGIVWGAHLQPLLSNLHCLLTAVEDIPDPRSDHMAALQQGLKEPLDKVGKQVYSQSALKKLKKLH